jgi:hypothetical protein
MTSVGKPVSISAEILDPARKMKALANLFAADFSPR